MTSCKPISTGDLLVDSEALFSPRLRVQPSAALLPPRISGGLGLGCQTSPWCQQPVLGQSPPCPLGATSPRKVVCFTGVMMKFSSFKGVRRVKTRHMLEDANRYSRIEGLKNGILRRLWDHLCISDWMAVVASCFQTKPHWNGGPLFWVAQSFFAT